MITIHSRTEPDHNGYTEFITWQEPDGWYWQPWDGEEAVGFPEGPFESEEAALEDA